MITVVELIRRNTVGQCCLFSSWHRDHSNCCVVFVLILDERERANTISFIGSRHGRELRSMDVESFVNVFSCGQPEHTEVVLLCADIPSASEATALWRYRSFIIIIIIISCIECFVWFLSDCP